VWRGTSFASPVIAAAVAALMPSGLSTREELRDALESQYPEWISTY
jgi:subtilase family serine protease